jgi:hypothetical protein
VRLAVAVLALTLAAPVTARAASCRGYDQAARASLKAPVEALRMTEREAADRLVGLDTRPFEHLLTQARVALAVIGDKSRLDEEDALSRCRNYIPPIRYACAAAGAALVAAIEEEVRGAVGNATKKAYADAMGPCEQFMGLAPLKTALRISDQ